MKLKDLEGFHVLDAVDHGGVKVPRKYYDGETETVNCLRMRIDGVTYVCQEDPSDGYHSMMEELRTLQAGESDIKNVFGYIRVNCVHRDTSKFSEADGILEIYDMESGKLIIEVGISSVDDYYPCFVASWKPENLYFNEGESK